MYDNENGLPSELWDVTGSGTSGCSTNGELKALNPEVVVNFNRYTALAAVPVESGGGTMNKPSGQATTPLTAVAVKSDARSYSAV
jgi:hypothetical protein